jgi:1-deoxyxylulose-5-phosphate synthase
MKYRYLGDSGLLVSRICLGTMTFGMKDWGCDQRASIDITRRFIEAGGNFIDTADMYSQGVSEEFLGTALSDFARDQLVIATKCWFRLGPGVNSKGLSRTHIIQAVEDSLRRLKTDYIDLYQLHGPDPHTPLEVTLRTLDDLVSAGKIRYVGCSNFYAWQIVKANSLAAMNGWVKLVSGQHLYNLLRRDVEREILDACEDQRVGLLCWSPLASGLLTGKYDPNQPPPADTRIGIRAEIDMPRYWNENSFRIIDRLRQIAQETGMDCSQVALAWLLGDRRVSSVIVGVRTVEQIASALAVGDWELSRLHRQQLADAVPFQRGYPHEWIQLTYDHTTGGE